MRISSQKMQEISQTIEYLYAAGIGEIDFEIAVESLRNNFSAATAQIFTVVSDQQRSIQNTFVSNDPETHGFLTPQLIEDNWREIELDFDPRMAYSAGLPAGFIFTDHQFIEEREILRSPFYQDFLSSFDLKYGVGANLIAPGSGEQTLVSINFSASQKMMDAEEMAAFELVVPHAQRALKTARTLDQLRQRKSAQDLIGSRLRSPVFVLDHNAELIECNDAARSFLNTKRVIQWHKKGIEPVDRKLRRSYWNLVSSTLSNELVVGGSGSLVLQDASSATSVLLTISPCYQTAGLMNSKAALIVTIHLRDELCDVPQEWLLDFYGFTYAEAEVAQLLVKGLELRQIARHRGVAIETVRSQVKSILSKSNCRGRDQFIRDFLQMFV